jgi:hypothetical protein
MKLSAATLLSLSAYWGLIQEAVSVTTQKEIGDINTCTLIPNRIFPYRYDMINGPSTAYNEPSYSGSVITYSPSKPYQGFGLGVGLLVDDAIVDGYFSTNTDAAGYIGFIESSLLDPSKKVGVNFFFDAPVSDGQTPIDVVTFYFSDGDGSAEVCAPNAVYIEGVEYDLTTATDETKQALQVIVYLETPFVGQTMHVEMQQTREDVNSKPCRWIFVSEVQFDRCLPDLPTSPPTPKSGKKSSSSKDEQCETIDDEEILPYLEYLCTKLLP